jgi:hypothetical protein
MDYGAKAATYVETNMAAIRCGNVDRLFAVASSVLWLRELNKIVTASER